ncbi:LysR substrate-binding domain-containing protein [Georgenia muralis]|uniref:LysR substrate binding domain-containing protein n=1 Tax=Georgenia muralis TaxID=154117 RepID=A0A3N4Z5W9_9MICO|nr:LysR substrate-binding domain-containing protein [Georgenia muralis]RPF26530.1 LysR substrate binding domain-containing protein [Georgenia muralis]
MTQAFRIRFVPGVSPDRWLRTWSRRRPGADLDAGPVDVADQIRCLREGTADMCFVRLPVDRAGLHVIPLYEEVPVVVVARDHPVAAFEEVDVADLAGEHLLQGADEIPEWWAVADEVRHGTRVPVPPMSLGEAVEVVASGAGVVVVPMSLARLHHRKDVVHRPVTGVAGSRIGLAWREGDDDPRIEEFVGVVRGRTERSSRGAAAPQGGGRAAAAGGRQSGGGRPAGEGKTGARRRGDPRGRRRPGHR